jgi:hypothetical protein
LMAYLNALGKVTEVSLLNPLPTCDSGAGWTSVYGVGGSAVISNNLTTPTAITDTPETGKRIVIDDIVVSSAVAMSVTFEEETSGTVIFRVFLPADGTIQITPRGKVKLSTANKRVMARSDVSGNVAITAIYHSEA